MSKTPPIDLRDPPQVARQEVADKQSGYSPIFGLGDGKTDPLPRWLPISLLALTTAALAVPIVLLRRQRAATALQKSAGAPPPPRRTATGAPSTPQPPARRTVSTSSVPPPRIVSSSQAPPPRSPPKTSSPPLALTAAPKFSTPSKAPSAVAGDSFNGAFYSAKAFGIATLLVGAGAVTTVWGVKQALGVQNTQEFAHRMRHFILNKMPFLSSRIHRPPDDEDASDELDTPRLYANQGSGTVEWSWPDAENRLKMAYEEGGIMGWAEAALRELEAEGELERSKRGHA